MAFEPADLMAKTDDRKRSEMIRTAVERDFEQIARAVGIMVRSVERGRDREWLRQRTEDVLSESLLRALERPGNYDPARPPVGWIVGIAKNVMKGEARVAQGRLRRADLDEAAFESMLGLIEGKSVGSSDQFDLEQMLSRLSHGHRKAIECRYLQGLGGQRLVEALGVASVEAARARVFRALQALRDLFAPDGSEVDL